MRIILVRTQRHPSIIRTDTVASTVRTSAQTGSRSQPMSRWFAIRAFFGNCKLPHSDVRTTTISCKRLMMSPGHFAHSASGDPPVIVSW